MRYAPNHSAFVHAAAPLRHRQQSDDEDAGRNRCAFEGLHLSSVAVGRTDAVTLKRASLLTPQTTK